MERILASHPGISAIIRGPGGGLPHAMACMPPQAQGARHGRGHFLGSHGLGLLHQLVSLLLQFAIGCPISNFHVTVEKMIGGAESGRLKTRVAVPHQSDLASCRADYLTISRRPWQVMLPTRTQVWARSEDPLHRKSRRRLLRLRRSPIGASLSFPEGKGGGTCP